jgi:hypothetical protein
MKKKKKFLPARFGRFIIGIPLIDPSLPNHFPRRIDRRPSFRFLLEDSVCVCV